MYVQRTLNRWAGTIHSTAIASLAGPASSDYIGDRIERMPHSTACGHGIVWLARPSHVYKTERSGDISIPAFVSVER